MFYDEFIEHIVVSKIVFNVLGDNLTDLNRLTNAVEKRQEFKTKSTPSSLEFSVRKPTPKIVEPKDSQDQKESRPKDLELEEVVSKLSLKSDDDNTGSEKNDESVKDSEDSSRTTEVEVESKESDKEQSSVERISQSPERLLDSSTDSVPPSESSLESSQTYTSSLESSSHSPPLDESSLSSEKVTFYCSMILLSSNILSFF